MANLTDANLRDADLTECRLTQANLHGVNLARADLRRADLEHIGDWHAIRSIRLANLHGVVSPPEGFISWAKTNGAVDVADDAEWAKALMPTRRRGRQAVRKGRSKLLEAWTRFLGGWRGSCPPDRGA